MQMAVSYPKELSKCSNEEIYLALLEHVKKLAAQKAGKDTTEKEKKKLSAPSGWYRRLNVFGCAFFTCCQTAPIPALP